MSQLRVESFSISLDGFGAGAHQSRDTPLGVGGETLHGWRVASLLRLQYWVAQVRHADARDHHRVAKDGWRAREVVEESNAGAE
jgi:hypothetical protein